MSKNFRFVEYRLDTIEAFRRDRNLPQVNFAKKSEPIDFGVAFSEEAPPSLVTQPKSTPIINDSFANTGSNVQNANFSSNDP